MWVNIPGCGPRAGCIAGQQRINVAHAVGGPEPGRADRSQPTSASPSSTTRASTSTAFEEMVDAVGGVVVDVDWPVKDDEYPTHDYGYQRIYFGPGPQMMTVSRR